MRVSSAPAKTAPRSWANTGSENEPMTSKARATISGVWCRFMAHTITRLLKNDKHPANLNACVLAS